MKESPELRAIRIQVETTKHDQEALGLSWLLNPEQAKLRRELPFLAEALDTCLKYVRQESVDEIERKLRGDPKPFTTKQRRTQDSWARHHARRRTKHKGNPRPHDPRTGQFLKENDGKAMGS